MNDTTQKSGQGDKPEPSIIVGGVLPDPHLRTSQQEDELRQVVRKDLQAFCPAPWAQHTGPPLLNAGTPQQSTAPWLFTQSDSPVLNDLLGSQTPLPHQNTCLSTDGFARDVPNVETQGDPQGTAREALQCRANELILTPQEGGEQEAENKPFLSEPRFDFKTDGKMGTRAEGVGTRYSGGETSSSSSLKDFFEGKYTVGGTVKGPSASTTWHKVEDIEGFAQGSATFGSAQASTSAGANVSGDWAGGDVNITGQAAASASATLLKAEGSLNEDGILGANGSVTAMHANAEAKGQLRIGTYEGTPTVTIQGGLSAELTVAEVKAATTATLTPYRGINPLIRWFNGVAEWAEWDTRIEELDKSWDWGIFIELGGKANVGLGAGVQGEAGALDKGRWGVRAKANATAGVGFGGNLGIGVQTPD